jgi:hypothetical protein
MTQCRGISINQRSYLYLVNNPETYQHHESPAHDTWPHPGMSPSSKSIPRPTRSPPTAHVVAIVRYCKTSMNHPQVTCSPQHWSSMESQNHFPLQGSTHLHQSMKFSALQSPGPMLVSSKYHHIGSALLWSWLSTPRIHIGSPTPRSSSWNTYGNWICCPEVESLKEPLWK